MVRCSPTRRARPVAVLLLLTMAWASPDGHGQVFEAQTGEADAWFGGAVDLEGGRLVVGGRQAVVDGEARGAADLFVLRADGSWVHGGGLLPPDGAKSDQFGCAVALAGDQVLVGARGDDLELPPLPPWKDVGSVSVFERDASGAWVRVQLLQPGDLGPAKQFGHALAVDGDRLVVGARWDNPFGILSGSAYVFERDADGLWTQQAKLVAPGGAPEDQFGSAVSLDGELLAVGAPSHDGPPKNAGAVHVFRLDDAGTWQPEVTLQRSGAQLGDNLGSAVHLRDGLLAAGVLFGDGAATDGGSVATWIDSGADGWLEGPELTAGDGQEDDRFGHALAGDGRLLAVGAERRDDPATNTGAVYLFARLGGGPLVQVAVLTAPSPALGDRFGSALALEGGQLLVGARFADTRAAVNGGQAFLVTLTGPDAAR